MQEIHVVGAAIMNGGKVLAAQRSAKMYPPLRWEFPGGKIEEGETGEQALEREIFEELGVRIKTGQPVAVGMSEDGRRRIVLHVYESEITDGEPVPREHSALKWVDIDDLGSLDWAEADIPACKALMKKYGSVCWGY